MDVFIVEDLSFFRVKKVIFQHFNLRVKNQQFIGLIGPNGTGKSTLLKLLAKLIVPHHGVIFYKNHPLNDLNTLAVAKAIAYMPQTTDVDYPFTVKEMVRMGRRPHRHRFQWNHEKDDRVVDDAIRQTGIWHLRDRLMTTLSGGEKQLVFLARTIAQQPEVFLLDEPTSDLDIYHQVQICQVVSELVQSGKTVIAAIHDINLAARYCDRILLLREGNVIAYGPPDEVLTQENLLKTYRIHSFVYHEHFTGKRQIIPYKTQRDEMLTIR